VLNLCNTEVRVSFCCMYISGSKRFLRCPTLRLHCFLSSHWPSFRFLSLMALEMQMKNKLMDETKDLAYFIRQILTLLPRFLISRTPFVLTKFDFIIYTHCRSQCPRGLRRKSAAARLLRLWVRIPSGTWMSVCCQCRVL